MTNEIITSLNQEENYKVASTIVKKYVLDYKGATEKILGSEQINF